MKNRKKGLFTRFLFPFFPLFFFNCPVSPPLSETVSDLLLFSGRFGETEFEPRIWVEKKSYPLEKVKRASSTEGSSLYRSSEVHETLLWNGNLISVGVSGITPVVWINGHLKGCYCEYRCDFRQQIFVDQEGNWVIGPWRKVQPPESPHRFAYLRNDEIIEFQLSDGGFVSRLFLTEGRLIASIFLFNQSYLLDLDSGQKREIPNEKINILNFEPAQEGWNLYGFVDSDDNPETEDAYGIARVDGIWHKLSPQKNYSLYCTSALSSSDQPSKESPLIGAVVFTLKPRASISFVPYFQYRRGETIFSEPYKEKGLGWPLIKKVGVEAVVVGFSPLEAGGRPSCRLIEGGYWLVHDFEQPAVVLNVERFLKTPSFMEALSHFPKSSH